MTPLEIPGDGIASTHVYLEIRQTVMATPPPTSQHHTSNNNHQTPNTSTEKGK
jgi:hypothetical protein